MLRHLRDTVTFFTVNFSVDMIGLAVFVILFNALSFISKNFQ